MSSSKRGCCTPCVAVAAFLIAGIVLVVVGGILVPVFKDLIEDRLQDGVRLKNGSYSYKQWFHPTSPVIMYFRLFDVQNPQEILEGKTPEVKERGPYAYREEKYKNILEWQNGGSEITYLDNITYHFEPSLSCTNCSEDDVLMTANVAVMGIADTADRMNLSLNMKKLLNAFVFVPTKASLFHRLSVRQIIWGYNDSTLIWLNKVKSQFPQLPIPTVDTWVALQYNASAYQKLIGNTTIDAGLGNVNLVQEYTKWRGKSHMSYWKSKYGNMLNGTDGTHFKPLIAKSDILYAFIPLICRSLYIMYEKEVSVRDIQLYRFTLNEMVLANTSVNPDNEAFCVPKCYDSGILPIGQCLPMNPPIMVSLPHFYMGAPHLSTNIKGLNPQKDKHETILDVEYNTGITMQVHKRLQINVQMYNVEAITILENITTLTFPILYLDESGVVDKQDADKFKEDVYKPILITQVVQYLLLAIGTVLVVAGVVCLFFVRHRTSRQKQGHETDSLLPDDDVHSPAKNYYGTQ